jgi:hypothetical protein
VIKDKMESVPRSYIVSTASGSELRRNRSQIRESFPKKSVRFDLEEDSPWVIEEDGTTSNQMNSPAADESLIDSQPELPVPCYGDQENYRTRSGRMVKPPRRLDL